MLFEFIFALGMRRGEKKKWGKKFFFSVWKPIRAIKSWLHLIYVSISISSSQTYHPHCYDVSIHDHNVMINNNHYKVKYKL